MPYISPNSSSALPKDERDNYEDYAEIDIKEQTETIDNVKDLYYGTEELLNALPRIWTHGILYVLIGFMALGVPWAVFSKVDETGSARGKIEPQGATQKLDSLASGSVKTVRVKEGDTVTSGQVLLELDSDILQTELQQAQTKLEGLQNRQQQLELLKKQLQFSINIQKRQNKSQELEKIAQVNQAQQNLDVKQTIYTLQKLEKQALVSQAKQQIKSTQNDRNSVRIRLSIDKRQVERFSNLVEDGAVSANQVDQLKKEAQESKRVYEKTESDIKQAQLQLAEEENRYQATITQLESEIKQAQLQLQEAENNYQSIVQAGKLTVLKSQEQLKDLQTQITAVQSETAQTQSQIKSIKLQMQQRIVRSPINGTIYQLPITKPGSVLQPGEMVAQIAPQNTSFVLKSQIPIQDSGFLKVGMLVKIKFDAYPFQEYGILPGKLTRISPDSKVSQTPQGNVESFELEITPDQPYIQNGSKRILLTAGQTATAEIIIRQRRIIDFVLDPFQKLQKDSL
ncbi:HlyD family efflux transporter periplasmic adaptor subunit [Anabaena sp. WFMT]|uniref:HlyD family efflux transporter periplasmic adaptor subunit n=1 Tax=Anabaena sp. WFMT TaxID=3449730 RepID=UPI003F2092BC